jgi:hypothetical protein
VLGTVNVETGGSRRHEREKNATPQSSSFKIRKFSSANEDMGVQRDSHLPNTCDARL